MQILGYAASYVLALETVKRDRPEAWATRNFSIRQCDNGPYSLPWVMLITTETVNPIHEPH